MDNNTTYECENCSKEYKTHKRYRNHLERCDKRLKNGYRESGGGYTSSRSSIATLGSLKRSRAGPRDTDRDSVTELDSRFGVLTREGKSSRSREDKRLSSEALERATRDKNRLKRELTECYNQLQNLKRRHRNEISEIQESHSEEIASFKSEKNRIRDEIQDRVSREQEKGERKLAQQRTKMERDHSERVRSQTRALDSQIEILESRFSMSGNDREIDRMRQELTTKTSQLQELSQRFQHAQQTLESMHTTVHTIKTEKDEAVGQVVEQAVKMSESSRTVDEYKEKFMQLQEQLVGQIRKLEEDNRNLQIEVQKSQRAVRENNAEVSKTRQKYTGIDTIIRQNQELMAGKLTESERKNKEEKQKMQEKFTDQLRGVKTQYEGVLAVLRLEKDKLVSDERKERQEEAKGLEQKYTQDNIRDTKHYKEVMERNKKVEFEAKNVQNLYKRIKTDTDELKTEFIQNLNKQKQENDRVVLEREKRIEKLRRDMLAQSNNLQKEIDQLKQKLAEAELAKVYKESEKDREIIEFKSKLQHIQLESIRKLNLSHDQTKLLHSEVQNLKHEKETTKEESNKQVDSKIELLTKSLRDSEMKRHKDGGTIKVLHQELQSLKKEREVREKDRVDEGGRVELLTRSLKDSETKKNKFIEIIKALQGELRNLKEEVEIRQDQGNKMEILTKSLKNSEMRRQNDVKKIKALQEDSKEKEEKNNRLESDLTNIRTTIESKVNEMNTGMKQSIEQKDSEAKRMLVIIAKLRGDLKNYSSQKIQENQKQLAIKDQEIIKLKELSRTLNARISKVPKISASKDAEISDLKLRLITSKESSLKIVNSMQLQMQNISTEKENSLKIVNSLQLQVQNISTEKERLKAEVNKLSATKGNLQVSALQLQKLSAENEALKSERGKYISATGNSSKAVNALQLQVQNLTAEKTKLITQVQESQHRPQREDTSKLRESLRRVKAELVEAKNNTRPDNDIEKIKMEKLRKVAEKARAENINLRLKVKELTKA